MTPRDEATLLRLRGASHEAGSRFASESSTGSPTLVARTKTLTTYPTSARSYFACEPMTVLGDESEGGLGSLTPDVATFFALNLGAAVPPSGTSVLVTFVGNRWVFRYDG